MGCNRNFGGRTIAAAFWNGGYVDVVGSEGRQILNGVLEGVVAHQDGDLGYLNGLGHSLCVNKLFGCIIRNLVVYWD